MRGYVNIDPFQCHNVAMQMPAANWTRVAHVCIGHVRQVVAVLRCVCACLRVCVCVCVCVCVRVFVCMYTNTHTQTHRVREYSTMTALVAQSGEPVREWDRACVGGEGGGAGAIATSGKK